VVDLHATIQQHQLQVAVADWEHQIPAHRPEDHRGGELPSLEPPVPTHRRPASQWPGIILRTLVGPKTLQQSPSASPASLRDLARIRDQPAFPGPDFPPQDITITDLIPVFNGSTPVTLSGSEAGGGTLNPSVSASATHSALVMTASMSLTYFFEIVGPQNQSAVVNFFSFLDFRNGGGDGGDFITYGNAYATLSAAGVSLFDYGCGDFLPANVVNKCSATPSFDVSTLILPDNTIYSVTMGTEAVTGSSTTASASFDPYIQVDPNQPNADDYSIAVSDGIGNVPSVPPSGVPEPPGWILLSVALLGTIGIRRRSSREARRLHMALTGSDTGLEESAPDHAHRRPRRERRFQTPFNPRRDDGGRRGGQFDLRK
jgi:hypothetical protein